MLVLTPTQAFTPRSFTPRSVKSFFYVPQFILNSFQTYSEKDIAYVRSSTQILVS